MADADFKRHVTKHLDRHNDYIAVYEVPITGSVPTYTDGGEAIEDLLDRVPDTATPHQVAAVISRAMVVVDENCCELWPDWSIHLRAAAARIFIGSRAVEQIAEAYRAVDRIDVEEVLAREA